MDVVVCPHCRSRRVLTVKIPRDVVAVMPCPVCHEFAVMFRDKVVPVDRRIIQEGSFDECKEHVAEVVTHFLRSGLLSGKDMEEPEVEEPEEPRIRRRRRPRRMKAQPVEEDGTPPISAKEVEDFVKIELKSIDDPAYFRKHFG